MEMHTHIYLHAQNLQDLRNIIQFSLDGAEESSSSQFSNSLFLKRKKTKTKQTWIFFRLLQAIPVLMRKQLLLINTVDFFQITLSSCSWQTFLLFLCFNKKARQQLKTRVTPLQKVYVQISSFFVLLWCTKFIRNQILKACMLLSASRTKFSNWMYKA